MYISTRSFIETIKIFCLSLLCSAPLTLILYRENTVTGVLANSFVCFILNLAAFVLFLFLFYKNWEHLYDHTYTYSEYIIPAIVSFSVYLLVSTLLYVISSFPTLFPAIKSNPQFLENIRSIYRYVFHHSRFLEPMLNREYGYVSFILAQILTLATLFYIPFMAMRQK